MPIGAQKLNVNNVRREVPGCGQATDCPLDFDPARLDRVAVLSRAPAAATFARAELERRHGSALKLCAGGSGLLKSGGWCLEKPVPEAAPTSVNANELIRSLLVVRPGRRRTLSCAGGRWVLYPGDGRGFFLPRDHVVADDVAVSTVWTVLKSRGGGRAFTISDFGAGVGQYGRSLIASDPSLESSYAPYDGAGNVEELTNGFVKFFVTPPPSPQPQPPPVGEHIPHHNEAMVIQNLHSHNCRGIILSWGKLGSRGRGHVNNHAPEHLLKIYKALGYRLNEKLTSTARGKHRAAGFTPASRVPDMEWTEQQDCVYYWLRTVMVFERVVPLHGEGCSVG
ncbi:hypothetical protein T492DRAFT_835431 [Pavlovales sp. CCMP2436]|nr:hypothetical protein T492DRAFT_835431 [Pavlovales sp. CCMP2436]